MFTDISDRLARNPPGHHYGIAVFDADGDGQCEAFICGFGGPNQLLKWDGRQFRDVAPPILADAGVRSVAAAAGDLDGDGREELYVMNADVFLGPKDVPDRLFDAAADGVWRDLFDKYPDVRNSVAGRSVAAIDRRGSGRYGFAVANFARPFRLYELLLDGALHDVAPAIGLDVSAGGRGLWVGPLVSDRSDLLCVNEGGPNLLFRNTSLGTFLEIAGAVDLADAREHARGVAVLDANGDGKLDVVIGNWDGPNRLLLQQPNGHFRDRSTPAMALPGPVRTVLAADFDNCGYEELFFNYCGAGNRLFKFDPAEAVWRMIDSGSALEIEGGGTGAASADFDNDGVLELMIAHGEVAEQPLSLHRCANAAGNWIRIQPLTRHGAPARGALVKLWAGARMQSRVIDGGSGYLCQMEPIAHFGLGLLNSVERIRITWPDGATRWVEGPPCRHTLRVAYPG